MKYCLEVESLSIAYVLGETKFVPLHNLKMQLESGRFYGLIGATGSGKSTLLKTITNVLPSNAIVESGSIRIYGKEILFQKSSHCSDIGAVLQNPYKSLNPTLKLRMQFRIAFGLCESYVHRKDFLEEVLKVLSMVELSMEVLDKYPSQLSGGMNQRINIALSLLRHPKLLLLDEPTSALDATLKEDIVSLIASIQQVYGITVLFISHDIQLIQKYAEKIFILKDGALMEYKDNSMAVKLPKLNEISIKGEILIRCNNLSKAFGKHQVFQNLNFCVTKGTGLGIVGNSGAGKSTICNIIMGLYKADSGQIIYKQGLRCEMLFQDSASSLDPKMTVRQILNEARIIEHLEPFDETNFRIWFERFSLPLSILAQKASQLSGGQRQLVAIIRILLSSPDIIILDEPTSAMDVYLQKQLLDFLKKLQKELGLTYILVSHDLDVIKYMCHNILKLE